MQYKLTNTRTTCFGIYSRSRTQRRDFWRAPGDATTSHQFCHVCTGCQWSNGSSSNWLYWSSSGCATKPLVPCRWLRAHRWLCARPTPMLSLFCELTFSSGAGVFQWRDRMYGTVFLPHCENQHWIFAVQI